MVYVYIIYSAKEDKYYIGQTSDLNKRIIQHNTGFYQGTFTSKSRDWEIYYKIDCVSKNQALKVEQHLKKMRSRKYIENLKRFPEIGKKLLLKYSS